MVKTLTLMSGSVQIEKVVFLTGKSEYTLSLAKSSNTPYKMISQCPNETPWDDLKCKLQEMYSMVATEYHTATDLLRKQRPNESLQYYITYWTEMCHCSMKMDLSTFSNKLTCTTKKCLEELQVPRTLTLFLMHLSLLR